MNLEFARQISKIPQISNFMKIRPVRAEFSMRTEQRTDRETDMTELAFAFRNFANASKIENLYYQYTIFVIYHGRTE